MRTNGFEKPFARPSDELDHSTVPHRKLHHLRVNASKLGEVSGYPPPKCRSGDCRCGSVVHLRIERPCKAREHFFFYHVEVQN
ncbi:uncharacterized protein IUM83_10149 [Phytophthora cinnamomi]|uniref:uncharacterized protein n=1 Tax=Phytophthora cinnamomi TaxID=4785 RepID=UPI0035597E60|nr:hypothetical protein IUM83_10149 [Phytophthora cinnamomi]